MSRDGLGAGRYAGLARVFGDWIYDIGPASLRADLLAGLLGALLVLPQGVAFATLAGLPPEYGLYSAIVPCVLAALFGSSRHMVTGPTNANSLALYAVLAPIAVAGTQDYIELALAVTVLVGVMELLVGALRLGALANFISPAALFGFTSGAAILIALNALGSALGVPLEGHGAVHIVGGLGQHLGQVQWPAVAIAATTVAVSMLVRRWDGRKPHLLVGLVVGTLASVGIQYFAPGVTVDVLGPLSRPLPPFHIPSVDWRVLPDLVGLAVPLTIVALAQSISMAKAVGAKSGQRIDANREFIGQGLANTMGGLFSSYLVCGSLNRSLPNYESGARTPLAAVFSSGLLILLVLATAPWLAYIPHAAIAGLLLLVAWNLLDLPRWKQLAAVEHREAVIAGITLCATVFIRMEIAILLGTLLSLVAYLHRTSRPAMRSMGFDSKEAGRPFVVLQGGGQEFPECPQLKLLRMEGSVYFGAAAHVADRLQALRARPDAQKHLLVMSKSMNFIDHAGAQVWEDELRKRRLVGGDLYFHRPRPEVLDTWRRTGFLQRLGQDHVFPDKHTAIAAIYMRLDPGICAGCSVRIFEECGPAGYAGQPGAMHAQENANQGRA